MSFTYEDDNLTAGQTVIVQARNVTTNAWETLTGGTLGGGANGTFNFSASLTASQIGSNSAIRFLTTGDGNNWDNGDNFYVDNFTVNVTAPGLNAGADTVNGGAGDDTIVWNANAAAPTDGRDIVNGGTEGAAGDTFVINGNTSSETYNIYTLAAWDAVAGNDIAQLRRTYAGNRHHPQRHRLRQCDRGTERDRGNPHQQRRAIGYRRAAQGPATRSMSSATSLRPACASTPSRSMATKATTRSTSRP